MLAVREKAPFRRASDLIALHIRFAHPSAYQLKRITSRFFFALNLEKAVEDVSDTCYQCSAMKSVTKQLMPQSSYDPVDNVGCSFVLDVMRRYRQFIVMLRESVTSYTLALMIESEKHEILREAILMLCAEVRTLNSLISIRVDSAPGLVALENDPMLLKNGITLDIGHVKNKNKNPIAERAIEELGLEIVRLNPDGGPISKLSLTLATANMYARIRRDGLSSRELWTQRDQVTGEQLPIDDQVVITSQRKSRLNNHMASAKSKALGYRPTLLRDFDIGQLVYLINDKDKTRSRDKYIVTAVSDNNCQIRKFTKNQFRAKTYHVKKSDCYTIRPTVLSFELHGPIR